MDNINVAPVSENAIKISKSHKISFLLLSLAVFFGGVFFLPIDGMPSELIKVFFISILVFLSAIFYILPTLKNGFLILPRGPIFYFLSLSVFISIISALFSGIFKQSFWGYGTEAYTAGFLIILWVLFVLTYNHFNSEKKIISAWKYLGIISAVVSLISVVYFIAIIAKWTTSAYNPIGFWADASIFIGLFLFLVSFAIQFFELKNRNKIFAYIIFVIALIFLILLAISLKPLWLTMAIMSALLFFVSLSNYNKDQGKNEFGSKSAASVPFIIIFVISIVVLIFSKQIINLAPAYISANINGNASASLRITADMAGNTLAEDPLLGPGPNLFVKNYWKNRPNSINSSEFWNVNLYHANGTVETLMISTGILGMLSWLIFFIFGLLKSVRNTWIINKDTHKWYGALGSISALFLLIILFIYPVGIYLFVLAIFMLALFTSTQRLEKDKNEHIIGKSVLGKIASIIMVMALIIVSAYYIYGIAQRVRASGYIISGTKLINDKKLDQAETKILTAANITNSDLYYQALFNFEILKLRELINTAPKDPSKDSDWTNRFSTSLQNAGIAGNSMVSAWPDNSTNIQSLGGFYASAASLLNDKNAYGLAKEKYNELIVKSPKDPSTYFLLAQLEFSNGSTTEAIVALEKAIEIKPDVADFGVSLSELYMAQKQEDKAVDILIKTIQAIAPAESLVLYEKLGITLYSVKRYNDAIPVFLRIIKDIPDYANIKFFLGISLAKIGDFDNAKIIFESIKTANPDNKDLDTILQKISDKKDPFPDGVGQSETKSIVPPTTTTKKDTKK